ncbi:MAG TPA: ROK family transcriptional regulator [Cellulomonas sp.]
MRETNLLRVFQAIRSGADATTAGLSRSTGLSRPSIGSLVAELVDLGWVEVVEPVPDGLGGRPPQRFRFRAEAGSVLGLDIGVHRVTAMVADLAGAVLGVQHLGVEPTALPPRRLARVDQAVRDVLSRTGRSAEDIWSTAAAVTGPVDVTGRTSLFSPLPAWTGVDLVAHLRGVVTGPVSVENDVKLALLAEQEWGVARGSRDVVYVLAGMRTGAAALVNGGLVTGHAGAAGEIGALPAVRWQRAGERLAELPGVPESAQESGYAAWTFEQARLGDPLARKVVRKYARDVATGAAALVLTLDPEIVVIGGGSTPWSDLWVPEFAATVSKSVIRMPEVRVSTMGGDHVALGAVRRAMSDVASVYFAQKVLPAARL